MDNIIQNIFNNYQVRKTKKQKSDFISFATKIANDEGYTVNIEKGNFGVRNIVVGNPDTAKVIYTAHYDTCARLPFPNLLTPKNIPIYLLYTFAIVIGFLLISSLISFVMGFISAILNIDIMYAVIISEAVYFVFLFLMLFGPANKHTANDNTSGVTVLFGIMKALPEEQRDKVAFVFFDLEEAGLIGSSAFASKHKDIKKNTLLLNYDCVSDGKNFLFVLNKEAKPYRTLLSNGFKSNGDFQVEVTSKAFYPSDQKNFKKGVGVASFNNTKGGLLYVNKIHTDKDTVFCRENIDFLINSSVKLTEMM